MSVNLPNKQLNKFNFWVQRVLPQVYDDSLSYYELLNKVVHHLNEVIESQNHTNENFESLNTLFTVLKNHVDNYFGSLDLKIELNKGLDRLVSDGTLDSIINQHLFNDLNSQLAQTGKQGYFINNLKLTNADRKNFKTSNYYSLFDGLVSDPRVFSRTLGKDQSGQFDIKLYTFEPTDYNATLFVVCALHGWEHLTTDIMYEVFKRLVDDTNLPPQLKNLRNTRIICIPVANPWGLDSEGSLTVRRGNSRGVDLNRNFDYRWTENTAPFGLSKGDAPFSEIETRYVRDVMQEYRITHFLDLHNLNNTTGETRDYLIYGNLKAKNNTDQIINWLKGKYPSASIEHITTENDSSSNNYANQVMKIPSINIELIQNRHGENDRLRWFELVLNYLILQADSHHRTNYGTTKGSKFAQRSFNATTYVIPTVWTEYPEMELSYSVDTDGIMTVHGYVNLDMTGDNTLTLTVSPCLSQEKFYTARSTNARSRFYVKQASGSVYIPFTVSMPVRRGFGDVTFKIEMIKEGTGTVTLKRHDASYIFTPCDNTYLLLSQHIKQVSY